MKVNKKQEQTIEIVLDSEIESRLSELATEYDTDLKDVVNILLRGILDDRIRNY